MVAAPKAGFHWVAVRPPDHRSRRPRLSLLVLYLACITIAVVLLLPETFLVMQASGVGWPELHRVLLAAPVGRTAAEHGGAGRIGDRRHGCDRYRGGVVRRANELAAAASLGLPVGVAFSRP